MTDSTPPVPGAGLAHGTLDDLVVRAMARWPQVPAMAGWLRLTRRGQWRLVVRDAPGFDPIRDAAGVPITSPAITDFIERNYAADDAGRWFWQNGPQRCYVTLEGAPLVLRVIASGQRPRLLTHTGLLVDHPHGAWSDASGTLYVNTEHGPAHLDDRDLGALALDTTPTGSLEVVWPGQPQAVSIEMRDTAEQIAALLGFQPQPQL